MRWKPDQIDLWLMDWALQRRQMLGLVPLEPKDRIGKLNSTLGAVKEDREGASQGAVERNFPEVYTGLTLLVHRAISEMDPQWSNVISTHFVYRAKPAKAKARQVGLDLSAYWKTLTFAKNYVHCFVTISTKSDDEPNKVMETQASPMISRANGLAGV